MGGKIDCYFDIASLYSYLGFVYLVDNLSTLKAHGVDVEFHPMLIGAVNAKTGNKPPWSVPAKALYGTNHEAARAVNHFGRPQIRFPKDLMSMGHTILPLRCLHYIKRQYPTETYHAMLEHLFHAFWTPPNLNLTQVDVLAKVLADSGLFSPKECETILVAAKEQEVKDMLTRTTQEALDKGAFGAPWLWVTNAQGKSEPFFGSDRFNYVYKFLGLPYQDVQLLPPGAKPKL
ncbi:thioredoxin-like protein [Cryphonectria parasitica EP155]|uniref:Glutathione S-transferase kappa n=1 Tax=Cryphonectria parasitica (strain ATCC 38755 / EP155) TaxID=660469 RepID=A0A9P5CTB5_CRYP1|nr:thioredoxin-like protein [Cryphonectria parasitica EP155]KAF3770163.1 thioredoxin-like protein [Cryphonectria parasitica EP155]